MVQIKVVDKNGDPFIVEKVVLINIYPEEAEHEWFRPHFKIDIGNGRTTYIPVEEVKSLFVDDVEFVRK